MGSAMPTFFFGILMILAFSILPKKAGLPFVPAGLSEAARDYTIPLIGEIVAGSLSDRILHLILPVSVLTLFNIAFWSRYIRSSMLEVLKQDYIRTARSKGLRERVVILKHALRNGLIPFITIVVFTLPGLFSGAIITESPSLPGRVWDACTCSPSAPTTTRLPWQSSSSLPCSPSSPPSSATSSIRWWIRASA